MGRQVMLVSVLGMIGLCCASVTPRPSSDRVAALRPLFVKHPELKAVLAGIQREIEAHAWDALLTRADPINYRIQVRRSGLQRAQYLAELLGLHMVTNNLRRPGEQGPFRISWLDRLTRVTFVDHQLSPPFVVVRGIAILSDGRALRWELHLKRHDGRWVLSGGLG